ncbi:MAG: Tc toxin subunit A [Bacteroidota bacterium]
MPLQPIKPSHPAFAAFYQANPGFDILHFDFHDADAVALLDFSTSDKSKTIEQFKHQQRALRIAHLCVEDALPERTIGLANDIIAAGFTSANMIAAIPEHKFIREHAAKFDYNGQTATTRKVYNAAKKIAAGTKHLLANIHGTVGSSHFRSMPANNMNKQMADYYEKLPGYQDLFNGLNYVSVSDCNSIFSPAAYFLDMMRIIDGYITDPNSNLIDEEIIPGNYKLSERRPDLFELALDCQNTNGLVPYLQIVNTILERKITDAFTLYNGKAQRATSTSVTLASSASVDDDAYNCMLVKVGTGAGISEVRTIIDYSGVSKIAILDSPWNIVPADDSDYSISLNAWQLLATAKYPFNQPFHLPLLQISRYLENLNVTFPELLDGFRAAVTGGTLVTATDITATLGSGASPVENAYNTMIIAIIGGKGIGQARTIKSYTEKSNIATLKEAWSVIPDSTSQYQVFESLNADRVYLGLSVEAYNDFTTAHDTAELVAPFYGKDASTIIPSTLTDISRVETFLSLSGLEWKQLEELLVQGLSKDELTNGVADRFYINNTIEDLGYMRLGIDKSGPQPFYKIENTSWKRLDRLSRFIRLANLLKWSFASLECALDSIKDPLATTYDISEETIKSLSGIKYLQQRSSLSIEILCSFWSNIKTTGKGNGTHPADLFDTLFNNPVLLNGQDPYRSDPVVPFNPNGQPPLKWAIYDVSGLNGIIRSRLSAALQLSSNDLTLLVEKFTGANNGLKATELELTLPNLSWLNRLCKAASFFKLTIDEYLILLGLLYAPGDPTKLILADGSIRLTIDEMIKQAELVDWFNKSPFSVYEALYIINDTQRGFFKAPYKTSDIASHIQNLSVISQTARIQPDSFDFEDTDTQQSLKIFEDLIEKEFLTDIGIVLNNTKKYLEAAEHFPFTENSFVTKDIITQPESVKVFNDLQKCLPAILISSNNKIVLNHSYNNNTNLDFIFTDEPDIDKENKRNQVRAILSEQRKKIIFTEYAFTVRLTERSFINPVITVEESAVAYQQLQKNNPDGNAYPFLSADGILNAAFDEDSPLHFLFISKGNGQVLTATVYNGTTKELTVQTDWETIPDTTSFYEIRKNASEGLAVSGDAVTIKLASGPPAGDTFTGKRITIYNTDKTKIQERTIVNYNTTTQTATVDVEWKTEPVAGTPYTIFEVVNRGIAAGGAANSIKLDKAASADNTAYDGMQVAIVDSDLKRGRVKELLLAKRRTIEHVAEIIGLTESVQERNVLNGLADFLQATPEMLAAIIPFAALEAELADYVDEFLTPIENGQVPVIIPPFISTICRSLIVFTKLGYTPKEIQAVINMPDAFNINPSHAIDLDNIRMLANFKRLKNDFNDSNDYLLTYFNLPAGRNAGSPSINILSRLTLWNPDQILALIDTFWPVSELGTGYAYNTVEGLDRIKKSFDLSGKTKIGVESLIAMRNMGALPLLTGTNDFSNKNWPGIFSPGRHNTGSRWRCIPGGCLYYSNG